MFQHQTLLLYKYAHWDSREALDARNSARRRFCATCRDISALALAMIFLVLLGGACHSLMLRDDLMTVAALTIFMCIMPAPTRRRALAAAARLIRAFWLSMAGPPRMSTSGFASAWSASATVTTARVAVIFSITIECERRVAALLLDLLGAVTATVQPRLAASLVAGYAASSAA